MRNRSLSSVLSLLVLVGGACCCTLATGQPSSGPDAVPRLYPASSEIRWVFYVPQLSFEWREVVFQTATPVVRSRRFDYEALGLRTQRLKLGQVPEIRCKYADWWRLPNECGVRWHDAYADAPVIALQRNHLNYEATEWRWEERRVRFAVPRWTWTERTLTLLVPVLVPEEQPPARLGTGG